MSFSVNHVAHGSSQIDSARSLAMSNHIAQYPLLQLIEVTASYSARVLQSRCHLRLRLMVSISSFGHCRCYFRTCQVRSVSCSDWAEIHSVWALSLHLFFLSMIRRPFVSKSRRKSGCWLRTARKKHPYGHTWTFSLGWHSWLLMVGRGICRVIRWRIRSSSCLRRWLTMLEDSCQTHSQHGNKGAA